MKAGNSIGLRGKYMREDWKSELNNSEGEVYIKVIKDVCKRAM